MIRPRREEGFTLLEVLISLLILSVGAASVLSLFAAGAATHRRSIDRTRSALLAERVFSAVRAAYSIQSEPREILEVMKQRVPSDLDGYRYELVLAHPEGGDWSENELFARVTIGWLESGQDRTESYQTILLPRFEPSRSDE